MKLFFAFAAVIMVANIAHAQEAGGSSGASTLTPELAKARVKAINVTIQTLNQQAALPAPKGLSRTELAKWNEYSKWITSTAARYSAHVNKLEGSFGNSSAMGGAGESMVQDMMAMNMEFLALQEAVQNENRKFASISTISRTRHDTIKNSINNLK